MYNTRLFNWFHNDKLGDIYFYTSLKFWAQIKWLLLKIARGFFQILNKIKQFYFNTKQGYTNSHKFTLTKFYKNWFSFFINDSNI